MLFIKSSALGQHTFLYDVLHDSDAPLVTQVLPGATGDTYCIHMVRTKPMLSVVLLAACATSQSANTPRAFNKDTVNDSIAVKTAVAKSFSVPSSMVGRWIAIRGDTAWAMFKSDEI